MAPITSSRITLLGIPIDAVTMDEAIARLLSFFDRGQCTHAMTPNSEMLVEAMRNVRFRRVLGAAAFSLPDSVGLLFAARWTHQRLPARIAGVDAVIALCNALTEQHSVFLLGSAPGVAARAAHVLQKLNPSLHIAGTYAGSPSEDDASGIIQRINASGARLLLVAYGAPMQDLWINTHLQEFSSVRLAMGVGGTFDFLAGDVRRAPIIFRAVGLEWLWRLFLQPWRIKRIWNAVIVFPLLVLCYGKRRPA